jgi:alpha-mannosidase
MPFERLTAILPCRSREELSQVRAAYAAEELLAAWTALWHPWLIATTRSMPRWAAADSPPEPTPGTLFVIPPAAASLLPDAWLEHAEGISTGLVTGFPARAAMTAAAIERVRKDCAADSGSLSTGFETDFLALGFCQYIVETVTQNLHYTSSLDEDGFERAVLAAADAVCSGDAEEAARRLQAAFDMLHTAREYYYHAESFLLDLTLVAETTMGPALIDRLANDLPTSLLMSGRVAQAMAESRPATSAAVRAAVERASASVIGGEFDELELPLLPIEAIAGQVEKGLQSYEQHLGFRPKVFGRRRFGMTPVIPQIAAKLGFEGVMHATLDDGRFPAGETSRMRWEGFDGTTVDALSRIPTDVASADAFQRLPQYLANPRDYDSSLAMILAHWPGRSSDWYDMLCRIGKYTTVLGSFVTAEDYFDRTRLMGMPANHTADEYRSPYLRQAIVAREVDPLSRWVRYYTRRAAAEAAATMQLFARLIGGASANNEPCYHRLPREVDDTLALDIGKLSEARTQLEKTVANAIESASIAFARAVGCPSENGTKTSSAANGALATNACAFARTVTVDVSDLSSQPDCGDVVLAVGKYKDRATALVQVPALGFAWIGPGAATTPPPEKRGMFSRRPPKPIPMAEFVAAASMAGRSGPKDKNLRPNAVVRNEFFELCIDGQTGGIRWLMEPGSRGPRLSQQVAIRLPAAQGGEESYSSMAADDIQILSAGPIFGEAHARGRLLDAQGRRLAGFEQSTRLRRGGRVVEIEIAFDSDYETSADPWESYYASRLAWSDDAANLYRAVNQVVVRTDAQRMESPLLTDIRYDDKRISLLAGGLPYHRRCGLRKLDTLLIVQGETSRRFRLGLGIDLVNPLATAIDFLSPVNVLPDVPPPQATSGWIFHIDTRGVLATQWSPLDEAQPQAGFRVHLLETLGRMVSPKLRCFRPPTAARKIPPPDEPVVELAIDSDSVTTSLRPYEWSELEIRF